MTDPYAPFPTTRAPSFPRERLVRAGVDEDTVTRLEDEYESADPAGRTELRQFVSSRSDDAIRDRYTSSTSTTDEEAPDAPAEQDAPTYDELNALTVDELDDRLRTWNDEHPDQHLTIAGRKGEKIGRLLDAYEGDQGAPEPETGTVDGTPQPAEETIPTAPTATTPEGTSQDAPQVTAPGDVPADVREATQTTDAAGDGATTTEE